MTPKRLLLSLLLLCSVAFAAHAQNPYILTESGNMLIGRNGTNTVHWTLDRSTATLSINAPDMIEWTDKWTGVRHLSLGADVSRYAVFMQCTGLTDIQLDDANSKYRVIDGVLFSADGTELLFFPPAKTTGAYSVPASVTVIKYRAFENANLALLNIHAGVAQIHHTAFDNAEITQFKVEQGNTAYKIDAGCLYDIKLPCYFPTRDRKPKGFQTVTADFIRNSVIVETPDGSLEPGVDIPCVLLFYGEKCSYSKMAKKAFEDLMPKYEGKVRFYLIEISAPENKTLTARLGFTTNPVALFVYPKSSPSEKGMGYLKGYSRPQTLFMYQRALDKISQ